MKEPEDIPTPFEMEEMAFEEHRRAREAFLFQCLAKVKQKEGVLSFPKEVLQAHGKVVTSQADNRAMAFFWKGEPVGCLTWDYPGGTYLSHSEPTFPYEAPSDSESE